MEKQIFLFFLMALAAVGLTEVCASAARWLCRSCRLQDSFLVVVVRGRDESLESRLTQACTEVCLGRGIRGAQVAVLAENADPETIRFCRRLCRSRGVPCLESLDALERFLC